MTETFAIDVDKMPRFKIGSIVDDVDRHDAPIKGRVADVKEGNRVALVIVEGT